MFKNILLAGLLLISVNVNATGITNKFYLGGSADLYEYSFYGVGGASIYAGYRWDTISLELGYSKPADESWSDNKSITFNSNIVYLDGILSFPLDKGLEAKGILGVGVFHTKTYGNSVLWLYPTNSSETSAGLRAGLGLQYNFDNNWAVDMSYKFQTHCNVFMGFMNIYSAGIKYHF